MRLIPYINLSGAAEEALGFYKDVFGGSVEITRWSEMPPNPKMPVSDEWRGKVMHGALTIREDVSVYVADSVTQDEDTYTNRVFVHVEFDSEDELRKAFDALSARGTINMPVDTMFWGAVYGDVIDKFGIGWGLHHQLPNQAS